MKSVWTFMKNNSFITIHGKPIAHISAAGVLYVLSGAYMAVFYRPTTGIAAILSHDGGATVFMRQVANGWLFYTDSTPHHDEGKRPAGKAEMARHDDTLPFLPLGDVAGYFPGVVPTIFFTETARGPVSLDGDSFIAFTPYGVADARLYPHNVHFYGGGWFKRKAWEPGKAPRDIRLNAAG